jgi:RimJ/RimL family protein N-acetyltransferase
MARDRLFELLIDAARGRFPPADLVVEVLPAPAGLTDAVVAFSGHNIVAADVDPAEVGANLPDADPSAPMSARFLSWLGATLASEPGTIDVVLVADPPAQPVVELRAFTDDATSHERVARARRYRTAVTVHADPHRRGLVIVGRGLANRLEVSIEIAPQHQGQGLGAELARAATSLVPAGEPLFAQVSPGNAASLRAFLSAGYRPIGSEVLFLRHRG